MKIFFNPIALRKAKIVYNFGLSECNRVKIEIGLKLKAISFMEAAKKLKKFLFLIGQKIWKCTYRSCPHI